MIRTLKYVALALLCILIDTTLIKFLSIRTIVPDILLILVVYIAIREGQAAGTIAGFITGLIIDMLSGNDGMLGLSAMSKTVGGFVAGYFFNENKTMQTLGSFMFPVAVGVSALLHNFLYFIIFLQGTSLDVAGIVLQYGIPSTLYTVAFSLLPMFAFARKYLT